MANVFLYRPVGVHLVNLKSNSTVHTYVFVGSVSDNIMKHLELLSKNPSRTDDVLSKFYGSQYRKLLFVPSGKTGGVFHGGQPDPADQLDPANLANPADLADQLDPADTYDIGNLDDILNDAPETLVNIAVESVKIKAYGSVSYINDFYVYPVDSILDFKYKIFMTTQIPIYRQHLWFKHKKHVYPCSYDVLINNNFMAINAEKLISAYNGTLKLDLIENIPVEPTWNFKSNISVVARDTFTLLDHIYTKYNTTEFFLADMADIITPDLAGKITADKYQLELIYYGFVMLYFPMCTSGVFADFLRNEKELEHLYPELVPRKQALQQQYKIESLITETAYGLSSQKTELNQITDKLASAITHTTVAIEQQIYDTELLIALRNLFDCVELSDLIPYCRASILHENKHVILRKSYQNEREARDVIPLNSILIKVKTSVDTNENMRLIIYKTGNYSIKTEWREENAMTFKKIINVVQAKINPIIRAINALGSKVKYFNAQLIEVTPNNVQFTETSVSYYYDDDITDSKFTLLKDILYDFQVSGVIHNKEVTASRPAGTYEYFFSKGMYYYDVSRIAKLINITNYYDFLSNGVIKQKWETLFIKTRLFNVANVASKLKVMISGIRDDIEMNNFYMYLMALISIYRTNVKKMKATHAQPAKSKKALKNLKLQDPLLYDFKKIYGSDVVYSKICQRPYQPVILTNDEYDRLTTAQKDRVIKYWNFTKEKPVFYSCPNPKYPYIKFITSEHPKKFCIPCCKKIEMSDRVNHIKQEIHQKCMTEHCYEGDRVAITKSNHYIASYGKPIEIGRICRLPEHTLEPLFFDTYSPTGIIDQECATADGFYLYGIPQSLPLIENVGLLFCLVSALGISVDEFLADCATRLRANPDHFYILLDGEASLYFTSCAEMANVITGLNSSSLIKERFTQVPWNKLFQNIAYYYYGINCIIFIDRKKEAIELQIPRGLTVFQEMFPVNMKNLIVLQHGPRYNPTFLFNTEIFKRTGLIDTKLFLNESGLVTIMKAVVRKTLERAGDLVDQITLTTVLVFALHSGAKINGLYINSVNMCYAALLEWNKRLFYFPVVTSYYTVGPHLIYNPYAGEHNQDLKTTLQLVDVFNKYVRAISDAANLTGVTSVPLIIIRQWLRCDKKIIGFIACDLYWYLDAGEAEALHSCKAPIQPLYYSPFKINALIFKSKMQPNEHKMTADVTKSLYNHHIYELILLQYISYFNSHRNKTMRTKIIKAIGEITTDNLGHLNEIITQMTPDDSVKFKKILSRYITDHHQKSILLDQIDAISFNFDRVLLDKFIGLNLTEIYNELNVIAKTFVSIGEFKQSEFPNILAPCDKGSQSYCAGNKLIVTKKKLHEVISVIAAQMTNVYNWKRLFNSVFISKTVDYFKFTRRKHETITIEILDS
jgi:hypothetical protein